MGESTYESKYIYIYLKDRILSWLCVEQKNILIGSVQASFKNDAPNKNYNNVADRRTDLVLFYLFM